MKLEDIFASSGFPLQVKCDTGCLDSFSGRTFPVPHPNISVRWDSCCSSLLVQGEKRYWLCCYHVILSIHRRNTLAHKLTHHLLEAGALILRNFLYFKCTSSVLIAIFDSNIHHSIYLHFSSFDIILPGWRPTPGHDRTFVYPCDHERI